MIALEEPQILKESQARRPQTRLPAHSRVVYRPDPHGPYDYEYLLDLAEITGLGGIFLVTAQTLPRGTVLVLEIESTGEQAPSRLRGRAVVNWRRRWGRSRGMQVELFEIEELGHLESTSRTCDRQSFPLPALS